MEYHNPVLLKETVDGLVIKPNGTYVDVTFGGGGHSKEILNRLGPEGKLFAFDQDLDALDNTIKDDRFILINENFRFIKRFLRFHGVRKVDGILGDFGVSSHQFDVADRGFSTRFDADLDMRMNQNGELSAYNVINDYEEADLKKMFLEYGELRNAPKLARTIIAARKEEPLKTSIALKEVLKPFLPKHKEHKILAQIYQAIRIEVNQEIGALKELLMQTTELLNPNGRVSFISYHSLEDRLVKRFIRNGMFEGEPEKDLYGNVYVPFKKVGGLIIPDNDEIKENNRARSAKLRIAERVKEENPA
ncbi:16S rRNA (cytosine(1402)-N(4))-methyltransferase RsmH [Aquimarina muelleri]|uniref:Ribosomal RNA small subunit methyltransferase H n=1 Tax=Aquimarina muelleri TaxID=279356 RepID=A0A918N2Y3_9FLAO|nr:16S rRNA (cytosine(1402)-N(4))-methyltransferase RsmH [Aquimarina muelleri]MCX2763137.1 16S rRNA (cytosine(1402)-N(4))-methyltransferase RsmH [Aquimarina muelleri]GGX06367.1 ribosomal RNA small subunit methyltransferase H [Aquimarina muelleri]